MKCRIAIIYLYIPFLKEKSCLHFHQSTFFSLISQKALLEDSKILSSWVMLIMGG